RLFRLRILEGAMIKSYSALHVSRIKAELEQARVSIDQHAFLLHPGAVPRAHMNAIANPQRLLAPAGVMNLNGRDGRAVLRKIQRGMQEMQPFEFSTNGQARFRWIEISDLGGF